MTIAFVWVHNSLSNAKLWQKLFVFLFPEMQKLFALFSQMQKTLAKLFALKKFSSSKDKLKQPTMLITTTTKTKLNASIKPNVKDYHQIEVFLTQMFWIRHNWVIHELGEVAFFCYIMIGLCMVVITIKALYLFASSNFFAVWYLAPYLLLQMLS